MQRGKNHYFYTTRSSSTTAGIARAGGRYAVKVIQGIDIDTNRKLACDFLLLLLFLAGFGAERLPKTILVLPERHRTPLTILFVVI